MKYEFLRCVLERALIERWLDKVRPSTKVQMFANPKLHSSITQASPSEVHLNSLRNLRHYETINSQSRTVNWEAENLIVSNHANLKKTFRMQNSSLLALSFNQQTATKGSKTMKLYESQLFADCGWRSSSKCFPQWCDRIRKLVNRTWAASKVFPSNVFRSRFSCTRIASDQVAVTVVHEIIRHQLRTSLASGGSQLS